MNSGGQPSGSVTVADAVFGGAFNETLVHQVVVAHLAAARAGTRAQKNRSQVRGGGAKPWRQKGTGRARAGTIRSPLWRTGGVTFAARPQNHAQKVNRRMYRGAVKSIFSELVRQERLLVIDALGFDEPKTKHAVALLAGFGIGPHQGAQRVLLIDLEVDANLDLATRNLANVKVTRLANLSPSDLVGSDKVVVSRQALTRIEEWLA